MHGAADARPPPRPAAKCQVILARALNSREESLKSVPWMIALLFVLLPPVRVPEKKLSREEARFKIYLSGKEIGTEEYSILSSNDSASSSSILDFRGLADKHQKIQMETQLEMDSSFLPRSYRLNSDVDGQKGTIVGTFTPSQAIFEYKGSGTPRKGGLLVGDRYTVLDTNIFHHFIFLARLFKYGSGDKSQPFEVVVPQEQDNGILKISEIGRETIVALGKKTQVHHLRVDSGLLLIDLWVEDRRILHKIAVPSKGIEAIWVPH